MAWYFWCVTALGELIRVSRLNCGLTQVELAERIACKQPTISSWETGRTQPRDLSTVKTLADELGIYPDDLIQAAASG